MKNPIKLYLFGFFKNPSTEGIIFFVVSLEAEPHQVVAEHIFIEVAHRAHVKNHSLSVD